MATQTPLQRLETIRSLVWDELGEPSPFEEGSDAAADRAVGLEEVYERLGQLLVDVEALEQGEAAAA